MIRIFIPSYGRAGLASTMRILPSAQIVVPLSQLDEYDRFYPGRVVPIPDESDGHIARKRNAILDLLDEDEACFMVDDDLLSVDKIKHGKLSDVEQTMEVFSNLAEDAQAYFGGFSNYNDPGKMAEYAPLSFTKPSYGCVYIRNDSNIRYDESLGRHEDVDVYLQYMLEHRFVLRDNRYYFKFECNKDVSKKAQPGGIEGGELEHYSALIALRNKWGDLIKIKDGNMNGVHQPIKGT